MFKYHVFALLLGTILDFMFGRTYSIWNPFDSVKSWAKYLDRALLGDEIILLEPNKQKSLGAWFIILSVLPVFVLSAFFTMLFYEISPFIGIIFEAFISYLCIEGHQLYYGAKEVMKDYYGGGIRAMEQSTYIYTGSNTLEATEENLTCATITYLSKETADSLISPLFIMFLFGPVGGMLYKTVDILDSQVGHFNNRYRYFGYYTARLNTVLDYIPGRFSGWITVFAAKHTFGGFNGKNAAFINLRDKYKAVGAFAGALELSLKNGSIGDRDRVAEAKDIRTAVTLMKNDYILFQLFLLILVVFF